LWSEKAEHRTAALNEGHRKVVQGVIDNRVHFPRFPTSVQDAGKAAGAPGRKGKGEGGSFAGILERTRQQGLSFSGHARQRLQARRIDLSPQDLDKLEQAVEKAAARGCRSSLLLYRDMAFVAGVPSRTIVTAMDGQSMREHIFTNIDSAVLIE